MLLMTLRAVVGFVRVHHLRGRGEELNDPDWRQIIDQVQVQGETGVQRTVRLFRSADARIPMSWGLWRVYVCLPSHADQWCAAERRMVLTHELAHSRRGDFLWQLLATAMTSVHWFNPLAWLAAHRLRMEAEIACDDAVLASGFRPSDYAACLYQLVRVARSAPVRLNAALCMSRPSEFPRRLAVILNDKIRRGETRFGMLVPALMAAAVLGSIFGAVRLDRAQADDPEQNAAQANLNAAGRPTSSSWTIRGKVVDKRGLPVAGAEVWLPIQFGWPGQGERRARNTTTDAQGRFTLELPGAWLTDKWITRLLWVLWVYDPRHSLGVANAGAAILHGDPAEITVEVGPTSDVSFVVLKPDGQPLPGATIEPLHFQTAVACDIVPEELMRHFRTTTDAKGCARFPTLPREGIRTIRVNAKGWGIQEQRVDTAPGAAPLRTIRLERVGSLEGRVIADKPEVVRGLRVYLRTKAYLKDRTAPPWPIEGSASVETDAQGRLSVPAIVAGALEVYAVVDEELGLQPRLPKRNAVDVEAGQTARVELPMVPTIPVRGSIRVQGTGKPVPNAEISIQYGVFGSQGTMVVSDGDGKFAARVLPGQVRMQVIVLPEQFARLHSQMFPTASVPEDAEEFDLPVIEVAPARIFSGRLLDRRGRPVAQARLAIVSGDRYYGSGFSDDDGRFTMGDVPESVDPKRAQYKVWLPTGEPSGAGEVEVIRTDPLVLRISRRGA